MPEELSNDIKGRAIEVKVLQQQRKLVQAQRLKELDLEHLLIRQPSQSAEDYALRMQHKTTSLKATGSNAQASVLCLVLVGCAIYLRSKGEMIETVILIMVGLMACFLLRDRSATKTAKYRMKVSKKQKQV